MRRPGAATSGLRKPSIAVSPRELQSAMRSSLRAAVPIVSTAPTVIADGALPGEVMPSRTRVPSGSVPQLPADATTTSPARLARSTACTSGSSTQLSSTGLPSERLMTRSRYAARLAIAQSIAAMTSLVRALPLAVEHPQADQVRARRHAAEAPLPAS